MAPGVYLRDGVEIEFASGERIVCDGVPKGSSKQEVTTAVSHAHGDHLVDTAGEIVASELTVALASVRQSECKPEKITHPAVDLIPAGHIAGSRAVLLTDPETDCRYLYTGDCRLSDRLYLDGFDPVDADVLILETTYGDPKYRFPSPEKTHDRIREWLAQTMDDVVILFGYALGRAQKLQVLLESTARSRVFITDAIAELNAVIESHHEISFDARRYTTDVTLQPGDAVVLPMQTTRLGWIESLIEATDAMTAGFSGWAIDDSFIYQRGVDKGFVLSDHCDYDELIELVTTVDPERVYTQHGFTETFATRLTREHGYDTQALKSNQSTLGDF
ncbi:MBL fold metallo-hydrolase RNA specificity domain-containing protein [Haloquadratum walsbyi]|uniref:Homolog to mRNA 3'-end processing factor n=1 Tax=Haloquadratum walsbyi (strain DSM 16854 / JCM 12705 / C23) TaxID=768065 RepID=G0LKW9_HALWC|nr:MBL fold metallo-hydrolase RNA specificity domain-containing protein [Haloquadratum walsbyi]CCC40409.1 homolog to mRNA 3'-end processing factor [Haloquadratum walsbyi C23]